MQIRVKSGFSQPRLEPILLLTHPEPKNVKHALADFKWKFAMRTEYDALIQNKTWSLVPLPSHKRAIGCKWIFRIKENLDEIVNKFKAILVAKKFFKQTFTIMVNASHLWLFLPLQSLIPGLPNKLMLITHS